MYTPNDLAEIRLLDLVRLHGDPALARDSFMRSVYSTEEAKTALSQHLYLLAVRMMAAEHISETDVLTEEWHLWCQAQKLECLSADDFLRAHDDRLTPGQVAYVLDFIKRWDAAENITGDDA